MRTREYNDTIAEGSQYRKHFFLFFSFLIKILKYKIKKNHFFAKQIATVLEFYNSVKSTLVWSRPRLT